MSRKSANTPMALFKCPECGNMISDKALKCPKCGNPPIKEIKPIVEEKTVVEEISKKEEPIILDNTPSDSTPTKKNNKRKITIIILAGIIVLCVVVYFCIKPNLQENKTENIQSAPSTKVVTSSNDFKIDAEMYGASYKYEGDMEGFPIIMSFTIVTLTNNRIEGEYENVKYGTKLNLTGQLKSDMTLEITGTNKSEKGTFYLYSPSPKKLKGYAIFGDKSLNINMTQIYFQDISND